MALRAHFPALLRNALATAEQGWPVFLLGRTKRPIANCPDCQPPKSGRPAHDPQACPHLTCHGFYAATLDPDRIQAMCTLHPGGLLAIRTGVVSALAVLDIDPRNGGALDPVLMPRTRCVASGGGGWHLYYRHPGGTLAAKLPGHPGVDIKADGGYIVAPPSIHPITRQPYRTLDDHPVIEMPRRLAAACRPRPAVTVTAPASSNPLRRAAGISNPHALLNAHLQAVRTAPEGKRRTTLYGAARGVARMVAAGAITHADAVAALTAVGRDAQQTPRDVHKAIVGGFRAEGLAV
ncbi:bifunctional DNA primase/polymerase [Dactylosporangium sp. NPDC000555]|uniref:bifunctional DNA primase/polymerase n=1 Tax=Dactylosporangium sp. NPDC000555 TaxID=3154260 RepID=UPI0033229F46